MSEVVQTVQVNQENNDTPKKRKLPFGHFKVRLTNCLNSSTDKFIPGNVEERVWKGLTQDELADDWHQVIPRMRRGQPVHHWSVNLAQLPQHLWSRYRSRVDDDGNIFYPAIKDGVYHYSVTQTEYDAVLRQLYQEVSRGCLANKQRLHELVGKLDNKVNGWLVIKARRLMKA